LAAASDLLVRIGRDFAPARLAVSGGVEDMVLLDLASRYAVALEPFMLDTGRLHPETHALVAAAEARYRRRIAIYAPDAAAVEHYIRLNGVNGFYESVAQRKDCCGVRKVAPLKRALAGARAWVTGQRKDQSPTRSALAEPSGMPCTASTSSIRWPRGRRRTCGRTSAPTTFRSTRCTRRVIPRSAVRRARVRWRRARTRVPAAGGGRMRRARSAVCILDRDCRRFDRRERRVMNAPVESFVHTALSHLDVLEAEAIHILREIVAETERPALLFSGGKDSLVLLRLAEKAFRPGRFPFPLLHVDTGHNYPEVIAFRDARAAELGERLIVRTLDASIASGRVRLPRPDASRNAYQTVTLLDAIEEFGFTALFGGARRDEEKARAKERIVSFRDAFGQWDPKRQRPELWSLYNARVHAASTCERSRFPTGPSSTSGNTSRGSAWRCRQSTSRTGAPSYGATASWCR
jgi:sulfate adenylyltransferase subunit 2